MNLAQFPPLCPFGDAEDDGATFSTLFAKVVVWSLRPDHSAFLRVALYGGGEASYHLGDFASTSQALFDLYHEQPAVTDEASSARFREWGFIQLADRATVRAGTKN